MESYCSLCTFKVPQGANNLILCTLDTIHRLVFVTKLIINKINKVQWVDFKLENVLVSLHSLKTMGLGSIIFKEWRVTWTFSYTYISRYILTRLARNQYRQNITVTFRQYFSAILRNAEKNMSQIHPYLANNHNKHRYAFCRADCLEITKKGRVRH